MGDRIESIDTVRAIAMAFIVAIHADLFRGLGAYGNVANFAIDTIGRFSVPFFFLTSGYLFARNRARDGDGYARTYLARLAAVYGYGLALYAPLSLLAAAGSAVRRGRDVSDAVLAWVVEALSPAGLLYYGDSVLLFLWFLPALAISIALVSGFVARGKTRYLLPVAAAFHVVGLLGQGYAVIFDVPLQTRDALCFGFFYTSVGYYIGERQYGSAREWAPTRDRSRRYLAATVAFGAAQLAERYALGYALTGDSIRETVYVTEYTIATAFFSTALFLFVLSRPTLGRTTPLPRFGRASLRIYLFHPIVLFGLVGVAEAAAAIGYALEGSAVWHLALTTAAYFGALWIARFAPDVAAVRRLVPAPSSHRVRRAILGGE